AALSDSYVLAHPSFHENFGVAVVEALACGCPAIVSDQVYLHPEITRAGVGSVTKTDADDVADELNRWLANPALRDEASDRARAFARSHFDWRAVGERWLEHYGAMVRPTATELGDR